MADQETGLTSWDHIEGIPDPAENRHLVGHRATLDLLAARHASGRMHHAWLLSGPRGIGKATLACRFAGHLFRHPDPGIAPAAYVTPGESDVVEGKVAAGGHLNLLHLRRPWSHENKRWMSVLSVDEVRRTVSFFGNSAAENVPRVCIVDPADDLNPAAANALLKMLEEPPPNAVFLVLAHSPKGLLPTIRSRCQKLDIRPLTGAQVLEALDHLGESEGLDEADRAARHLPRPGIRGHDERHVPEVGLPPLVVGQRRVVHDLQQHVEDVRMRLLDLVEQQHGVRVLAHLLDQLPALVVADVAGRRADQP